MSTLYSGCVSGEERNLQIPPYPGPTTARIITVTLQIYFSLMLCTGTLRSLPNISRQQPICSGILIRYYSRGDVLCIAQAALT